MEKFDKFKMGLGGVLPRDPNNYYNATGSSQFLGLERAFKGDGKAGREKCRENIAAQKQADLELQQAAINALNAPVAGVTSGDSGMTTVLVVGGIAVLALIVGVVVYKARS
jgi:hypothetical protein